MNTAEKLHDRIDRLSFMIKRMNNATNAIYANCHLLDQFVNDDHSQPELPDYIKEDWVIGGLFSGLEIANAIIIESVENSGTIIEEIRELLPPEKD